MAKYIARRVLYMIPILFGVTLVTFILFNVAGGDPAATAAGRYATPEMINALRAEMGLDKSYVVQYFHLLKQIFTLDWGRSWSSKQDISFMLREGVGPSLTVTAPAFIFSLLISVVMALLMAYRRNTFFDKSILIVCLALTSISSVVYVLAGQYFAAYKWGLFPISGWDPSWSGRWQFVALPILIMVVLSVGGDILFFRTVFLEEMFQDYVRTARAKGIPERVVLFKHVLRNALIPIITLTVLQLPFLILGSLLIESYYGIPGVGGLAFQAIQEADFPVIKALTIMSAVLYIVLQLVSDILYALVDPKVRFD
ncbi:MAG: ABC transporter permease [Bdellovibrionales bacterium]